MNFSVSTYNRGERSPRLGTDASRELGDTERERYDAQKEMYDIENHIYNTKGGKDDAKKEHYELFSSSGSTYTQNLADDLFSVIQNYQTDPNEIYRLCRILPSLLQQFTFRINLEVTSDEGRDIMHDIYRNRRCV